MIRAALPGLKESKSRRFFRLTSQGVESLHGVGKTRNLPGLSPSLSIKDKITSLLHSKPYTLSSLSSVLEKEESISKEKTKNFQNKIASHLKSLANSNLIEEFKKQSTGTLEKKILFVRLKEGVDKKIINSFDKRAFRQIQVLHKIFEENQVSIAKLESSLPGARSVCARLYEKKIIEYFHDIERQEEKVENNFFSSKELELTEEQFEVVSSISNHIEAK